MEPDDVPSLDEKPQAPANCYPVSGEALDPSNICLARPVLRDRSVTSTNAIGGSGAHNLVLAPSGFNAPSPGLSQYSRMLEQTLLPSLLNPSIFASSIPTGDPSQPPLEFPLVTSRASQNAPIGMLNSHLPSSSTCHGQLACTISQDALNAMFKLSLANHQAEKSALEVQIQTLKREHSELENALAGMTKQLANRGKAINGVLHHHCAPYSEPSSDNDSLTIPKATNHSPPHDWSDNCKGAFEHTTTIDDGRSYHPGLSPDVRSKMEIIVKERSDNSLSSTSPLVVVRENTNIKRARTQVENGSAHKKMMIERDQSSVPSFSIMAPYVFKGGVALRTEEDDDWLSDFVCFVRANCAEAFCATEKDVASRRSSQLISLGQVGIRCIFCSNVSFKHRSSRSCCFPSSMSRIYQSMTMMVREHFSSCTSFPKDVRERYNILKAKVVQGSNNSKKHWVNSAQQLGMVDTPSGIYFAKCPTTLKNSLQINPTGTWQQGCHAKNPGYM